MKHKKVANDAECAKGWAKTVRSIEAATHTGGDDPTGNPTLDDTVKKVKKASVPDDNIGRTRKCGSGEESGGADQETTVYEGCASGGVALVTECLTDNRNRAAPDVRLVLNKNNGDVADNGAVTYPFEEEGVVELPKGELTEDDLLTAALDAGAEEVNNLGEKLGVVSALTDLMDIRTVPISTEMEYDPADQDHRASTTVALDADGVRKLFRLVGILEEPDDVQNVYSNADISDEITAELDDQAFVWRRFR